MWLRVAGVSRLLLSLIQATVHQGRGFSLRAARVVQASDRVGLERLSHCRQRGPFAAESFTLDEDAVSATSCQRPRPNTDGRSDIVLEGARPAAPSGRAVDACRDRDDAPPTAVGSRITTSLGKPACHRVTSALNFSSLADDFLQLLTAID